MGDAECCKEREGEGGLRDFAAVFDLGDRGAERTDGGAEDGEKVPQVLGDEVGSQSEMFDLGRVEAERGGVGEENFAVPGFDAEVLQPLERGDGGEAAQPGWARLIRIPGRGALAS